LAVVPGRLIAKEADDDAACEDSPATEISKNTCDVTSHLQPMVLRHHSTIHSQLLTHPVCHTAQVSSNRNLV
jgi:hypothetical protein